jgi:iron complex transport system permease protein
MLFAGRDHHFFLCWVASLSNRARCSLSFLKGFPTQPFWTDTMEPWFSISLAALLMACWGVCVSAAGAAYQGLFQNPMAATDILGAHSQGQHSGRRWRFYWRFQYRICGRAFVSACFTVGCLSDQLAGEGEQDDRVVLCGIWSVRYFGRHFIYQWCRSNQPPTAITYLAYGQLIGMTNMDLAIAFRPWRRFLLA